MSIVYVPADVRLRSQDGTALPLPVARWLGEPSAVERAVLNEIMPPVLDVGCGPGRHVLDLNRRGIVAMGVDAAPAAVLLARSRGAAVVQRSIFELACGTGRWGTALLLDGNVGIGGNPERLLRKVRSLLRPGGTLLVEVEPPATGLRATNVRLETRGAVGPWFPWAVVGADALGGLAAATGFAVGRLREGDERWFARLVAA